MYASSMKGFDNGKFLWKIIRGLDYRSEARHSIQDVHFRYIVCQNVGFRSEARHSIQDVHFRYIVRMWVSVR